jgi:hypothetical protein
MEMRLLRTVLLAGAAALALGIPGAVSAQTKVMTVALPGGGVAEIHYSGNVPPRVVVSEAPASFAAWTPAARSSDRLPRSQ